jgi:PTH1 family peptidyl-tRNA hydrolase
LKIVLGLGNPGTRYRATRHNLGFRVVDRLADRAGASLELRRDLKSWTAQTRIAERPVVLARPRTYMNRSGRAALALCRHHDVDPAELLVIYDDADLALGRLRIRPGGSAGGHNGLTSLIQVLGTDAIPRVRLGVRGEGRDEVELADYVLDEFEAHERPVADELVKLGAEAVVAILGSDVPTAMNRFNSIAIETGGETES